VSGPLHEALALDGGIVCAVGAGGKKTALYRIASESRCRYALTATVFSAPPGRRFWDRRVLAEREALAEQVLTTTDVRRVAYAGPSDKPGRIAGVDPELIARLHQAAGFELTLVKADGARMRGLKAPRRNEPVLPANSDLVLHLSSAAVLGQPLDDEQAHRLDELEALTGLRRGERIGVDHLARLLASPEGAARNVGDARLVAVINQVDDRDRLSLARQAAEQALAASDRLERVVLACLRAEQPVLEVMHRDASA
jgi:probable selenium-dependent hydroxylase accessory protein YqeC